jgi:hypothetical protein
MSVSGGSFVTEASAFGFLAAMMRALAARKGSKISASRSGAKTP